MRAANALLIMLVISGAVCAETVEVTLRDGLNLYEGTEDFLMYAPESVASVNYGVYDTLTAGINRWGEHYTSIIRFDLSDIPPGARVEAAALKLYHRAKDYPARELALEAHALLPANAGWTEGSGDGARTPTPGAPCWNFRRFDTDPWAGSPGARKAGVDYSTEWTASAQVAPNAEQWIALDLPPAAIQKWVDDPSSNAGLHLWPSMAQEKRDAVYLVSSEGPADLRPALVLSLTRTTELASALGKAQCERALRQAESALSAARAKTASWGGPARSVQRLDGIAADLTLAKQRVAANETIGETVAARVVDAASKLLARVDEALLSLPVDAAAQWNADRGLPPDFALGIEDTMTKVFRRDVPFSGELAEAVTIRLARNEFEGAQVVVLPIDQDITGVTWELRGLDTEGLQATVTPVGYVKSAIPALVTPTAPSEWWPDPLLSFMDSCDVPRGEQQPLWVNVHASESTPPGTYEGTLLVGAENAATKACRIRVEVFDFAVPVEQHLKTIWGMTEANYSKYYADRYDEEFAWRYFDMFLDHRMAVADLYRTKPTGVAGDDSLYHLASPEALKRLRERGSGWWNVGYVLAPQWAVPNKGGFGCETYEQYLDWCVTAFKAEVERVRAAGWPQDRLGIYFLDETSDFDALGKAAEAMKAAFPDIPLMTTGYDRSYGLEDTLVSKWMDIWVPLTPRYHEDREKIAKGRELGKQVWWYVCVGPRDSKALNWFVQYPAIRARLLMGVAARKYDVDGFLYYRVAGWNNNDKPITTGPYTDWVPKYHDTLPDGDGHILCAGPEGPLSTVRLENIRDGAEDYEYYWVLDDLIARAEKVALTEEGKAALEEARACREVPDALLKSVTEYTEDPQVLADQRLRVARAIEGLGKFVQ